MRNDRAETFAYIDRKKHDPHRKCDTASASPLRLHLLLPLLLLLVLCSGLALMPMNAQAATTKTTGKKVIVNLRTQSGTLAKGTKSYVVRYTGSKYGTLPKPTRKGYIFMGWWTKKTTGTQIKKNTKVTKTKNHYLYAHWKVRTYTITYELNGGKNSKKNPSTYTVLKRVKLCTPRKTGYNFEGWYTTPDFQEGTKVTWIRLGSTGKKTFYAKFTQPEPETESETETEAADPVTPSDGYTFTGKNNIEKLYNYFQYLGYTKEASAAICGNLMWESGGGYADIKLNAVEIGSGAGIGMCQWTDTADAKRRTNFINYCKSVGETWPNTNLKVQADFLVRELTGKEGLVWYFLTGLGFPTKYKATHAEFMKMTDVELATGVFCCNFERPQWKYAGLDKRVLYAEYVLKTY